MKQKVKALSIRQPWAWLIVHGHKEIENRPWFTHFRGPLLIHAAKNMSVADYERCASFCERVRASTGQSFELPAREALERAGIVGRVEMTDCLDESESAWFVGPFGFVFQKPSLLPFTPFRGSLSLFDVPANLFP